MKNDILGKPLLRSLRPGAATMLFYAIALPVRLIWVFDHEKEVDGDFLLVLFCSAFLALMIPHPCF
jgi:hypothetical protein